MEARIALGAVLTRHRMSWAEADKIMRKLAYADC